jgi:hypothetical protein
MRTTVTLDFDVERLLRSSMRERGVSLKQALNEAVRAGLTRSGGQRRRRFVQKSYSLGREQLFRWDQALSAAEAMEDEERSRKLSGCKCTR